MIRFKLFLFLLVWMKYPSTYQWNHTLTPVGVCTFYNVRTSGSESTFNPSRIDAVTEVHFNSSLMHFFTDKLCKAFPNLENLLAERLSMIRIEKLALHECNQLTYVSFWKNKLESVDKNVFEGSPKLQFIIFQENRLKSIKADTFLQLFHTCRHFTLEEII